MNRRRLGAAAVLAAVIGGGAYLVLTRDSGGITQATAATQLYQCSMHPQIVSDQPGTCPICGMRLTPVEGGRHGGEPAPEAVPPTGSEVPGHASFELSAERQQLIGVRRGRVEERDLALEIRAVGRVAYDPQLYQAIVEYREALTARQQLHESTWHEARQGADALVRASALRLRQRGLSEEQLRGFGAQGGDPVNLLLPGKNVWVYAQVYEPDMEQVRPGETIVVTAPSLPGRSFTTRVVGVDPILDATTRTARVRALVPTPDAELRPEMFVNVRIEVPLGRRVAVPREAILDTGEHQIAFVVRDEGRFEPRSVTIGRAAQGFYEVLAGLAPGEEVVTSANFLIDSESRFRAALETFGKQPGGAHQH